MDLQKKIDAILENGVAPTVAIVRIGDSEEAKAFEERAQVAGNAFAVAIEKFIFPEACDETDVMDVLEVINDDHMLHALIILRPLPEKFDELKIRSILKYLNRPEDRFKTDVYRAYHDMPIQTQ